MIRTEQIPRSAAWTPAADTVNSFANGIYQPCKILGPARLVRLLSHVGQAPEGQMYKENLEEGSFWFDEQIYFRIRSEAEADLRSQMGRDDRQEKLKSRLGMYLRHQFRNLLAVRRNWTPSFDFYIVLDIPANNTVVALAGSVGEQPVYSNDFAGAAGAKKAKIRLEGGLKQYVIDFRFGPNAKAVGWIVKPIRPIQ
jgi:hypothetical protein